MNFFVKTNSIFFVTINIRCHDYIINTEQVKCDTPVVNDKGMVCTLTVKQGNSTV